LERNPHDLEPRPRVGMGVLVMRKGLVLLGKRRGAHGEGYYAAPGGHIELGETLAETARREVREECGLEIRDIHLLSVGSYLWEQDRHYVDVDVVCEALDGEPRNLEPENCEGWAWYDLEHLPAPLFIVTRVMLDALCAGQVKADLEVMYRQGTPTHQA
jgi:8-oxo-dGTP diphosphatase